MGYLHHRFLVKLKKIVWFIVAATSLSALASYLMLGLPTSILNGPARIENGSGRLARTATGVGLNTIPRAVPIQIDLDERPGPKRLQASSRMYPNHVLEKTSISEQHPLGMPPSGIETIDLQDIENRILSEQLAESLRNPAYLSAILRNSFEPDDPDELEEAEVDSDYKETEDPLRQAEAAYEEQAEEESFIEDDRYAAEADGEFPYQDRFAERFLLTEAGTVIRTEVDDLQEIENRILEEQLAESLSYPAYQRNNSGWPGSEDIASEDQ